MKNRNADGLRGVAALNVVLTHFVSAFLPTMLHKNFPFAFPANPAPSTAFDVVTSPLATLFYNGQLAVLIFFALSGYVLTLPYFTVDAYRRPLQKRLLGRYLRLNIPIAAAILASYLVYRMGWYANLPAAAQSGSTPWLTTFFHPGITAATAASEALYGSVVLGQGTLIPPLWTLKIEFIGSLYVLAFYLIKPVKATAWLMLPVFPLLYWVHGADAIYYYGFFLGSTISRIRPDARARLALVVVGVYFGCFQFDSAAYRFLPNFRWHGQDLWDVKNTYSAIGALCLTTAIVHGFGRRFFEHALVQFLARISFSLYLLHFIVLCSLASWLYLVWPHTGGYLGAILTVYIAVCFVLASVFERYVDQGAIRLSHRFASKLRP